MISCILDLDYALARHDKHPISQYRSHQGRARELAKCRQQAKLCAKVKTRQSDLLATRAVKRHGRVDVPCKRIPARCDGGAVTPGEGAKRPWLVHAAYVPVVRRIARPGVMVAAH